MMKGKFSRKMFFSLIAAFVIVISTITLLTACNNNKKPSGNNEITVTISQTLNGTVTADKEKYLSGDTVTLTFAPDDGYELDAVSVNEINRTAAVRNGELVMENVTENLTVTTTFVARATGTVSYTVKDNAGGTVQLSKTSGYIGESVTLTLTPERGYDVMSVVVNGGVNIANTIKNNSIEIELTQSVNTVEVEFYAFPIKVFATANDYGTVSIDNEKEIYALDDTVEIVLTPKAGYILDSLLVNGEEKIDGVSGNKLTFTISEIGNINVTAVFALPPVRIDFAVLATRFDGNYDIKGASVEFKHENGKKYHDITINNESKIVADVVPGKYTVTIDGFEPVQLTVGTDGYTTQTTFVYNPFKESVVWNTSNYADGKVSNSGHGHLLAKDEFDNFVLTVTLKKKLDSADSTGNTGLRTSINFKYGNKMIGFSNDGKSAGLWLPGKNWGNIPWSDTAYETPSPDWYGNEFANTAYSGNGAVFKFVRQGTKLYLFVENTYVSSWEIFTADQKVNIALTGWGSGEIPINISTDTDTVNGLVESNITVGTVMNGTVTLDKTDGKYKIGDTVELTLAADTHTDENKKYVLKTLTVDGQPVDLSEINSGVYTFKATKSSYTVAATFEEVNIVNLNIQITATKFGVEQTLNKVTLSGVNYSAQEFDLTEGRLVVSGLADDTYKISAEGYIPVTVNSETTSVKLAYNLITEKEDWTISSQDGVAQITPNSGYNFINLKDNYQNFVISGTFKHPLDMADNLWNNSGAIVIKVGGKVCGFQLVGRVIKTMGDFEGMSHIDNAAAWDQYTLTQEQQNKYHDSSLKFTIVRQGKNLHLFLDDTLCKTMDFSDFDNGAEVQLTIAQWGVAGEAIPVTVSTQESDVTEWVNKAS